MFILEYAPEKISKEINHFARDLESKTGANVIIVAGRLKKSEVPDAYYLTFGCDIGLKDQVSVIITDKSS